MDSPFGYRCEHFEIKELVSQDVYDKFGEFAWSFLSPQALITLDRMRAYFNKPITVNDWSWRSGGFQYRGLRPPDSTVGGHFSQHRFGRAFDLDVQGMTAEEVRQAILSWKNNPVFALINCIEDDVSWVHFDCRNILSGDRIKIVKP